MKKLFLIIPTIVLVAAACQQQSITQQNTQSANQQTTQPPTPIQTSNNIPSNWQAYTSTKLGVTFKYPQSWGKPVEVFNDSSTIHCQPQDDVCNANKGKTINIHFSNDTQNHTMYPIIAAASPDFSTWEGGTYYGQVSLEDYYNKDAAYSNHDFATPATNTKLGSYPALTYITATVDGMGTFWGIQTIAKINSNGFSGMTVLRDLDPTDYNKPSAKIPTDIQLKAFVQEANSNLLDSVSESKIDEYKLFLSTIQFTK